jgi:PAS domain S-box-containing protein
MTMPQGHIDKPIFRVIFRVIVCSAAVLAITALVFVIHVQHDRLLSAALNLFLIVVLAASIRWGTGYAIFLSLLSALAFSLSLPPAGHFHLRDARVWTLIIACSVTGCVAGQLSRRARREALHARRSEKEVRDVIETIPAMAWSALPDGSSTFVSRRWTEYTGLTAEDAAGSGWQAALHPEDLARHVEKWRTSVGTGQPFEDEARFRHGTDGEYRWFLVRAVPVRNEQGHIVKWYGALTDIEDRKRAEEALHAVMSERARLAAFREEIGMALAHGENLRAILHNCAEAMVQHLDAAFARIWILSSDGRELRLQASAGMYTRLDGSHSRIPVGQLKIGLIAQERKPHLTNDVQNDARVNDKDWALREKMVSFAGYPLIVEDRLVGVMCMFSQKPLAESTLNTLSFVTDAIAQGIERKRAEEAVRRSEAWLADAQALTHTGSFVWDVRTREALYLSDEWYRIFGVDPEMHKDAWAERWRRVHPEDRAKWHAAVDRAIKEKCDYDLEERLISPDGTTKYIRARGHPVPSAFGEVVQFMGSVTDITERKRAEAEREKLRQLETDLAHLNRVSMMGELAASLAHEIKQPITAAATNARTSLRWLMREPPDIVEASEAVSRIVSDVNRAAEIIERDRSLYRRETPQRELVNLNEVIREMIVLLRDKADRNSILIRTEIDAALPTITADRVQLQQVLMNLILNGMEAMEDTGGELTVTSKQTEDGQLLVSVSDSGIGLPVEQPERVFETFFTTKPQGTGMGLSISRRIIESHGGRLWASANTGRGATFQFTLPTDVRASSASAG